MNIGELIKKARTDKKWSLRKMAELSGAGYESIRLVEKKGLKKGNISVTALFKISESLGIDTELVLSEYLTLKLGLESKVTFPDRHK